MHPLRAEEKNHPPKNNNLISSLTNDRWAWVPYHVEESAQTMQRDRDLFERIKMNLDLPCLRFYRWKSPTVSFGKTHDMSRVPQEKLRGEGWSIVQRPTGGGTVLHKDDLCFSLVWRKNNAAIPWSIKDSYLSIHKWIRAALNKLDIDCAFHAQKSDGTYYGNALCFNNPVCSDLLQGGKKVVGGAQWRSHDVALHQGSIQLELSSDRCEVFRSAFQEYFKVRFVESHITVR